MLEEKWSVVGLLEVALIEGGGNQLGMKGGLAWVLKVKVAGQMGTRGSRVRGTY